jgi:biotin carboxylase
MTSAQAAVGVCSILWLVDGADPAVRSSRRALERFGQVVDLEGLPPRRWADAVAPRGPQGIVTFSDERMTDFARLAEDLGLPFHRPEVARRLTDKVAQREVLRSAGLPVPKATAVASGLDDDALEVLAKGLRFPVVLKPVHGSGGRTCTRIDDPGDLLSSFRSLFRGSRPDMIIEEYLADGGPRLGEGFANYLSVESVVADGRIEHFAITGRFPLAPPLRETGFFIPAEVTQDQRVAAFEVASAAARAIGIDIGCLHTEIKFTPDGPRVIEVNGRLGGGIPLMLEMATGASAPRLAMEVALGRAPDLAPLTSQKRIAYRLLFHGPMTAHEVLAIKGLENIRHLPGAPTAVLHRPPGAKIDWRTGTDDYVYSVIGVARDHDELRTVSGLIADTVEMQFEAQAVEAQRSEQVG